MKISYIVYWYVERSVGDKVGRVNGGGVECDFDAEIGSSYLKVV